MNFIRFFSHSSALQDASKSALGLLRSKTGYSLSNCRKALQLNDNNAAKAEQWLREQAKAMGWAKVQKLEGRGASQGLIGVSAKDKKAVLVEVNCETDFVARNAQFKSLVEKVVKACYREPVKKVGPYTKKYLDGQTLAKLKTDDGQSLENEVALVVGNIGENILLRRAVLFDISNKTVNVAVDVHPPTDPANNVLLGKYGSLIIYETNPEISKGKSALNIGVQLCKHIIGMNPRFIGNYNKETANEIEEVKQKDESKQGTEETEVEISMEKDDDGNILNQDFLIDPDVTVGQFLEDTGTKIYHFERYECGESIEQAEQGLNDEDVKSKSKVAQ